MTNRNHQQMIARLSLRYGDVQATITELLTGGEELTVLFSDDYAKELTQTLGEPEVICKRRIVFAPDGHPRVDEYKWT